MPLVKRAELIDGIVYMPSPVSDIQSDFHLLLGGWLLFYAKATPGCAARLSGTWLMPRESVPQPGLAMRILAGHGGQSWMENKYPAGAPELIVEISHATSLGDSGTKLRLYERSGVREYLIVRPEKQQAIWRELFDGGYREIAAGQDGILRSRVFPGLWLDVAAVWSGDFAGLTAVVQQGMATVEHAEFVNRLELAKLFQQPYRG